MRFRVAPLQERRSESIRGSPLPPPDWSTLTEATSKCSGVVCTIRRSGEAAIADARHSQTNDEIMSTPPERDERLLKTSLNDFRFFATEGNIALRNLTSTTLGPPFQNLFQVELAVRDRYELHWLTGNSERLLKRFAWRVVQTGTKKRATPSELP
jgi:hypothetical protein